MMKKKYCILYVDDEQDNLTAFNAVFRRHYQVLIARSGDEALQVLQNTAVDLVLTDLRMPGMPGVELLEIVRRSYPSVIRMIVTGYSDMQAMIDAINKGKAYHYITKPWNVEELKVVMDNALETYALRLENERLQAEKNEWLLQRAQLEKENIFAQFENLKNQINPHFLFNSINVLSSLILTAPEKAVEFVNRFARVFRHLLALRGQTLISLQEELDFVESFLFLQQIRFDDSLRVQLNISQASLRHSVPPLALHTLVENAIKHNEVSAARPLLIEIKAEAEWLTVQNNLQARANAPESTGLGLKNLQSRYQMICRQTLLLEQKEGLFVARIPLIAEG